VNVQKNKDKEVRILVQRADRLGDVVFSLPVLERIKKDYPSATIDFLTSKIGNDFVKDHPLIRKTIISPANPLTTDFVNYLKSRKYNLYISLWNEPKFAYLGKKVGIPCRIGDSSNLSLKWLYTHPVFQNWRDFTKHQIEFNLDLLKPLKCVKGPLIKSIPTDSIIDEDVCSKVKLINADSKQVVLIFIGTGGSNAPIPEHEIKPLVEVLTQKEKFFVILCGEKSKMLSKIEGSKILNLLGKTSLKELVSYIKFCDFYIGPDTGPSHIASFFDKPLVFFCARKPNAPTRFGPVSTYFKILRKDYTCPYFCQTRKCTSDCSPYVTASSLHQELIKIVLESGKKKPVFSDSTIKTIHMLNSVRVMYLVNNRFDFMRSKKAIENATSRGLIIFPYLVRKSKTLDMMQFAIKKNINVIQSHNRMSVFPRLIQFYVGTIKQYVRPIYVNQAFIEEVSNKDYLAMYTKEWDKVSKS
jgi:ADP-heptose:LPS heptosyltransferase